jgi:secreted trypsin-like serine protease
MNSKLRLPLALLTALALVLPASAAAGPSGSDRIVGGQATTIEEWPWQVGIARPPSTGGNGFDRQFCGGSLIAPTMVLTAAHCVYDDDVDAFKPATDFSVITGRTTLSSSAGAEIPASELIYFVDVGGVATPQSQGAPAQGTSLYQPDVSSAWDVALLRLTSTAPAPAAPIQVAGPGERIIWEPGDPAFVTGWGDTTGAMTYADDLQEAEVEIIADSDCSTAYGTSFLAETMVCAGIYPLGGKDSCQGDSGGPLVVPAGDGSFRLVGDTSFGIGCALPGFPGVYGRVADDPMRSAIARAIPPAISTGQITPPTVSFSKKPRAKTRKRKATFVFTADKAATFICQLDRLAPAPCTSPYKKRVKRKRHTFTVTATDTVGNAGAPVSYSWKVKKKKRRR